MLVLGHAGITLGAATLLSGVARGRRCRQIRKVSWFVSLGYIDIRLLLVGSLLPDIIDKPVGQYFFRDTFSHGRIFSHTLLFLIIIALAGFFLYKSRQKAWMLILASGTFMHLVLDEMWYAPRTLFWPLLGFEFERIELADWMLNIWYALMSNPGVYVPEMVGLVILLWFGLSLVIKKKVMVFIKYGKTD